MNNISINEKKHTIVEQIITNGQYFILDDFLYKQTSYDFIKNTFLKGIEITAGYKCYKQAEQLGLDRLHEYYPAEKIMLLEKFVKERATNEIIKMVCEVGKYDLNIEKEFFINTIILVRIKYPFLVGKDSKLTYEDYIYHMYAKEYAKNTSTLSKLSTQIKSSAKKISQEYVRIADQVFKKKLPTKTTKKTLPKSVFEYNAKYPYAAFAHGPHLDSWFGAPYSLEFWWSIAGVTEENGLIFYTDTFKSDLKHMEGVPFIAHGIELSNPQRLALLDGSLLIFHGDVLHGAQLNISDKTRIAVSVNVSLDDTLYFSPDRVAGYDTHIFHSSNEISKDNFSSGVQFKISKDNLRTRKDYCGTVNTATQKNLDKQFTIAVSTNSPKGEPIALCLAHSISVGEKVLFKFKIGSREEDVMVIRSSYGLHAVSAICPHLGSNLVDGFHDEQHIHCPGHGLVFGLTDGLSKCNIKLKVYKVYEDNDMIYIAFQI